MKIGVGKPMVSVCITTYNQEKYLAEALDSVLSQKVDFEFEIIIGEDYSTDSTLQIAQDYQTRYPGLIKVVQSGHKEKLIINGHTSGRYNFLNVLSSSQGKYIALLDGDDYWIDQNKLQKQVDFLEQHEEYSFTFHNVYMVNINSGNSEDVRGTFHPSSFSERDGLDELLLIKNFVPTSSVVFRNNIPGTFPDVFYKAAIGDWPLHLLNLNFGQVKYMQDVMGVYRIGSGLWSNKSRENQLLLVIDTYKYLAEIVPPKLIGSFKHAAAFRYKSLIHLYLKERKLGYVLKTCIHFLRYLATGKIK